MMVGNVYTKFYTPKESSNAYTFDFAFYWKREFWI